MKKQSVKDFPVTNYAGENPNFIRGIYGLILMTLLGLLVFICLIFPYYIFWILNGDTVKQVIDIIQS